MPEKAIQDARTADAQGRPTALLADGTQALLLEAMEQTADGIGIYDQNDRLIYTNSANADLFGMTPSQAMGRTFSELIRHAHETQTGINLETDDIEQWLKLAFIKRRRLRYRSFQTDTRDGRWLQLTEQLTDGGQMFTFFTDITEQKRIERKLTRLSAKLRQHANTDHLTGINNRRAFFRQSRKELSRGQRVARDTSLLLIDVDFFKRVNDEHGHQMGDRVLVNICTALAKELRQYDLLGRLGGEEFAVLIPETGEPRAWEVAERLRLAVAAQRHDPDRPGLAPTLSIGVAVNPKSCLPLDTLIRRADQALYQAKEEGRNRSILWQPSPT